MKITKEMLDKDTCFLCESPSQVMWGTTPLCNICKTDQAR